MSGGGGGGGDQTTRTEPPEYLKPFLRESANAAKAEFAKGTPTPYPGSTVLDFNSLQEKSMQDMLNTVNSGGYQALTNSAITANNHALNLPQNIQDDQTLKNIVAANEQSVQDNLVNNTLRTIRGDSVQSGTYDSTRTGVMEGRAVEGASAQLANANARLYGDAYNNALKYSQVATQNIPNLQNSLMQPSIVTGTVGDAYASLDQARAFEDQAKYYEAQDAEAKNIMEYISLLNGSNHGGISTTSTPGASSASKLLGAGMTGLGAYGAMASMAPAMATPVGWGAAALALLSS